MHKKIFYLNLAALVLIAFNLRAPITVLGPMVGELRDFYGLSGAAAGLLTTLPLLAFGSVSFVVGLARPLRAMLAGLVLIIIGEALRGLGAWGLFIGMGLLGCGVAIANVLLPSFVKEKFPRRAPAMMGLYSLVLNLSSLAGLALAGPLLGLFGLPWALLFWLGFAGLALVIYLPQFQNSRLARPRPPRPRSASLLKNKNAWLITLFMGFQSFIAYALFAWYVEILAAKGFARGQATDLVLLAQLISIPVSLLAPWLLGRLVGGWRSFFMAGFCGLYVVAFLLLLFFDGLGMMVLAAVILGIPWGGVFGIALLFIAQKSASAGVAARLSGLAQGVGYLIAALAPWLIGLSHDIFHSFGAGILILICVGVLVNIFGFLAQRCEKIT